MCPISKAARSKKTGKSHNKRRGERIKKIAPTEVKTSYEGGGKGGGGVNCQARLAHLWGVKKKNESLDLKGENRERGEWGITAHAGHVGAEKPSSLVEKIPKKK